MPMQVRRTATANNPPAGLAEGQLAVEMASTPPRLWVGVPAAIDVSGRILLAPSGAAVGVSPPNNPSLGNLWWDDVSGQLYVFDAGGQWVIAALSRIPTVQHFTSGSGSYVPATGLAWIRVRMCGGGGGGGGVVGGTNGGIAGTTSFGGWTALGGGGGTSGLNPASLPTGGAGGTGGANGVGLPVIRVRGGGGSQGANNNANIGAAPGGVGGSNPFGGYGVSNITPPANSGGGGSGSYSTNPLSSAAGGGGAGEYVEFLVSKPGPTSYAVGAGGAGGTGASQGGNGADGIIIVEENY